ncbi:IPExxxVDY family protein [Bacteroidota bacterium]
MNKRKSSKKRNHKLYVDLKYDFKLIGIASHEIDYKLIWAVNQALDMNFVRQENLIVYNKKLDTEQSFSLYNAEDENNQIIFNFISNRCENGFLAEEINTFDYFLQIIGEISNDYRKEIIKKLKSITKVLTAIKIDPNCLVSKQKLVF